jgi:FtsP/CotA-like multicopper oxidase with cupredoxin domain
MTRRLTQVGSGLSAVCLLLAGVAAAQVPGGTLDPTAIPKYVTPLPVPGVQPPVLRPDLLGPAAVAAFGFDSKYEIGARQFRQQVLPAGFPQTTVWGYGNVFGPPPGRPGSTFNYPAFTVEARTNERVNVTWSNLLVDGALRYLPHLLTIDQTLHWANPTGVCLDPARRKDCVGIDPAPYRGPVPLVTHLHGAHVTPESDGYPEAWTLPPAWNIPPGYERRGTFFGGVRPALPGTAVFQYKNDQAPTTLWYHDHTLGMTRANVYAGLAGFWLIRDPSEARLGLPGPAPRLGERPGTRHYELPILIQDRSFNADGSLFYPDNRDFFEGLAPGSLASFGVHFAPTPGSDVAPFWNPEFFGNTMVVNGATWPILDVEQRRYRFRFLNGCDSRAVMLENDRGLPFHQIGADQGFLPAVVSQTRLLLGPAERADVIMDFTNLPVGTLVTLVNVGPDEPFGGGEPGIDFAPSDPGTTGKVMRFRVGARVGRDTSTPVARLVLPRRTPLPAATRTRVVSLNELGSATEVVCFDNATGAIVGGPPCAAGSTQGPYGPTQGLLGNENGPLMWADAITENPALGATEIWEIRNFTADAHPIHVHQVAFEVVERQQFLDAPEGNPLPAPLPAARPPEPWESGAKDTVLAYPGEITRIKATFDIQGLYVWHCHILSHEDNEMMRPFYVGDPATSPLPVDPSARMMRAAMPMK